MWRNEALHPPLVHPPATVPARADRASNVYIPWEHRNFRYVAFPGSCGRRDYNRQLDLVPEDSKPVISGRLKSDIPVEFGDYPWVARVIATFSGRVQHTCLGSLIGKRHLLTAGSCLFSAGVKATIVTVVVGDSILDTRDCALKQCTPEPQSVRAEKVYVHSELTNWAHKPSYDIALLKLYYDVTYNGFVRPICLPYMCDDADTNTQRAFPIAGYGEYEKLILSRPDEDPIEKRLLETKVQGVGYEECNTRWNQYRPNTQIDRLRHICVDPVSPRGKACVEDLGSPLMQLQVNRSNPKSEPQYWLLGQLAFGVTCKAVVDVTSPPPLVFINIGRKTLWIMTNLDTPLPWFTDIQD